MNWRSQVTNNSLVSFVGNEPDKGGTSSRDCFELRQMSAHIQTPRQPDESYRTDAKLLIFGIIVLH